MGITAEPLHEGHAGTLMRASKALTVVGTLGTLLTGRRSRLGAALSGAALHGRLGVPALRRLRGRPGVGA